MKKNLRLIVAVVILFVVLGIAALAWNINGANTGSKNNSNYESARPAGCDPSEISPRCPID